MAEIRSEMAGIVLEVKVRPGERIKAGQEVAVLESMKMHVPVESPQDGVVRSVVAQPGAFVNQGDPLLELE